MPRVLPSMLTLLIPIPSRTFNTYPSLAIKVLLVTLFTSFEKTWVFSSAVLLAAYKLAEFEFVVLLLLKTDEVTVKLGILL